MRRMYSGTPVIAMSRGVKRALPPGIPMEACCSFPASFWNLLSEHLFFLRSLRIMLQMMIHLSAGSWMVNAFPSKFHPRISFWWDHVPSPFSSFFSEIGSAPQCLVTCGGGKMECIPCSIERDTCVRCWRVILLVAPTKSSTYTSSMVA